MLASPVDQPPKFITQIQEITQLVEGQSAHFEARLTPTNDPNLVVSPKFTLSLPLSHDDCTICSKHLQKPCPPLQTKGWSNSKSLIFLAWNYANENAQAFTNTLGISIEIPLTKSHFKESPSLGLMPLGFVRKIYRSNKKQCAPVRFPPLR